MVTSRSEQKNHFSRPSVVSKQNSTFRLQAATCFFQNRATIRPIANGETEKDELLMIHLLIFFTHTVRSVYDERHAQLLSHYTAIIRCPKEQVLRWNCSKCANYPLKDLTYIQDRVSSIAGMCGYLAAQKQILFVFRRTENSENEAEDISFQQIDYQNCHNCKVHQGFYIAFMSVQRQVLQCARVLTQKYPNSAIVVAGHSLGSAIATFAALRIQLQFGKVISLTKLGAPRVGNQEFSQFVTKSIKTVNRVVHFRDIVPHLPPHQLNFRHQPTEIFYSQDFKSFRICNTQDGQDPNCSNSQKNLTGKDHDLYFIIQTCESAES